MMTFDYEEEIIKDLLSALAWIERRDRTYIEETKSAGLARVTDPKYDALVTIHNDQRFVLVYKRYGEMANKMLEKYKHVA